MLGSDRARHRRMLAALCILLATAFALLCVIPSGQGTSAVHAADLRQCPVIESTDTLKEALNGPPDDRASRLWVTPLLDGKLVVCNYTSKTSPRRIVSIQAACVTAKTISLLFQGRVTYLKRSVLKGDAIHRIGQTAWFFTLLHRHKAEVVERRTNAMVDIAVWDELDDVEQCRRQPC